MKISETREFIKKKNKIFEEIRALPLKEQREFLKYICSISLDDGINMLLRLYHSEENLNEILIPIILNLDVIKNYKFFMQKVNNSLTKLIAKHKNINKEKIEGIRAYFLSPERVERLRKLKNIDAPSFMLDSAKKMLYTGIYVKEYNLDKPLILSRKYSSLRHEIDEYYAHLLVHRRYAPLEFDACHESKRVIKETMNYIEYLREAQKEETKEWHGALYPYADSAKGMLIRDIVASINEDIPVGYEIVKDEQLQARVVRVHGNLTSFDPTKRFLERYDEFMS